MSNIVELGRGLAEELGISGKAARLDTAARRGLPVPRGVILTDGADLATAVPVVAARFTTLLAVRSAFSAEDAAERSMAGHFHTELHVEPTTSALLEAIERVLASGDADMRRDVLIMEMVDAKHAGVAFSEPGFEDDLINVVRGQGEQLVSGAETGDRLDLARIRRWERANAPTPWGRRLQTLLRDVRSSEGDEPWDIEWADDDTSSWLLQVRPITAPVVRDELFTLANHREILPDPPSVLMSSIIMSNGRRLQGPGSMLGEATKRRGYFAMFDGRPYINQSITIDLVRALGLPSALVSESLGGDDLDPVSLSPRRIALSLPTLARLGADQAQTVGRARRVGAALATRQPTPASFADAANGFADDHLALVEEMGNLVSAMTVPMAILRRLGALDLHFSALETPGTRIMSDLRAIAELTRNSSTARDALSNGEVPDDPEVARAWAQWLADHGHRGRFESDIAEPRFAEDPESTLRLIPTLAQRSHQREPASATKRWLTMPLWLIGRRALVAREELRTRAMRGFGAHRQAFLTLARAAAQRGQLVETEAVWDLTIEELSLLDDGHVFDDAWLSQRREAINRDRIIDVPEVRRRFSATSPVAPPDGTGIPLYPGVVEGRAWVLTEPSTELPDGFDPASTVLIARSVDAGWVPTFGLVGGVAVDIGGDLSHGSIILREMGLPSITNTRGLTRQFTSGDVVRLDASSGRVEIGRRSE